MYNSSFTEPVTLAGSFTDPTLPAGYAPFNIETVAGNLYVAYAKVAANGDEERGPGFGYVGDAIAPASFGDFSNDLLVGNFGDGRIRLGRAAPPSIRIGCIFTAGINDEVDGLFGAVAVTPEPGTLGMLAIGVFAVSVPAVRRRRARR